MSSEQGQSHLFDLDPPPSTIRRIAGVVIGCAVFGLLALLLWFLFAPVPATGASSSEPVVDSILNMCGQLSIPAVFSDIAELALPLWSRFCNAVQH